LRTHDSFLGRLLRYAPRPGRVPAEDFLTEALAGLLIADPELVSAIFGTATTFDSDCSSDLVVDTQFSLETGRPDLVLSWDRQPRLIVENKLAASFTYGRPTVPGDNDSKDTPSSTPDVLDGAPYIHQLQRYTESIERNGWPAKLLLLSQWPREDIPDAVRKNSAFAGNIAWYQIFDALRKRTRWSSDKSRILCREMTLLLEDLGMTPPTPLRFGDGAVFHNCFELKGRMAAILEQSVSQLRNRFVVDTKKGTSGNYYEWWSITHGDLELDLGLLAGARTEDNAPIWPILHIRPDPPATVKNDAVLALSAGPPETTERGWQGKAVYPTNEQMSTFLGAWDWAEQTSVFNAIVNGWFEKLAAKGLLAKKL